MWTACQCIHSSAQLVESIFRSCWKTWQSVLHLSRMICHLVYVMKLRYSAHRLIFKWHWNTWQSAGWCHTLILSFFLCTFRDSWAYCGCHVGTTLVTFCHQFEVQLHLARTLWCTTFSQGNHCVKKCVCYGLEVPMSQGSESVSDPYDVQGQWFCRTMLLAHFWAWHVARPTCPFTMLHNKNLYVAVWTEAHFFENLVFGSMDVFFQSWGITCIRKIVQRAWFERVWTNVSTWSNSFTNCPH